MKNASDLTGVQVSAEFEVNLMLFNNFHDAVRRHLIGVEIVELAHIAQIDHRVTAKFRVVYHNMTQREFSMMARLVRTSW